MEGELFGDTVRRDDRKIDLLFLLRLEGQVVRFFYWKLSGFAVLAWLPLLTTVAAVEYALYEIPPQCGAREENVAAVSNSSSVVGCDSCGEPVLGCGDSIGNGFLSGAGNNRKSWAVSFTQTVDYGTNLALPLSLTPANTLVSPLSDPTQIGILDSLGLLNPADPLVPDFQDDFQFQTSASVMRNWNIDADSSFSAGYGYYQNLHPNVEELDLMSHSALAKYSRRLSERTAGAIDYVYFYYFLDDESFVSQSSIIPSLLMRYNNRWDLKGTVSYGNASFRNTPFLSSDNYAATAEAIRYSDSRRQDYLSLGSGYGYSNAVDDAFTYRVPNVYAVGRWLFGSDLRNEFRVTGSYSYYRFQETDPVEVGVRRQDDIYSVNPILSRTLNENVKIFASYYYYNSDSNLVRQLYDQNVVSLGMTCDW